MDTHLRRQDEICLGAACLSGYWRKLRPIAELAAPELLAMLRAIEKRGTVDMAHRVQQHCGAIFRYAVSDGKAISDPTPSLKGALSTVKQEHYAALTDPAEMPNCCAILTTTGVR